jgi:hypothetical protein
MFPKFADRSLNDRTLGLRHSVAYSCAVWSWAILARIDWIDSQQFVLMVLCRRWLGDMQFHVPSECQPIQYLFCTHPDRQPSAVKKLPQFVDVLEMKLCGHDALLTRQFNAKCRIDVVGFQNPYLTRYRLP